MQVTVADGKSNIDRADAPDSHRTREGFSVFGLFRGFAHTAQGKRRLRQLFLRPTTEIDIINERLDVISTFCHPANEPHTNEMARCLRQVRNIKLLLNGLQKGAWGSRSNIRSLTMWDQLLTFAALQLLIQDAFQQMQGVEQLQLYDRLLNPGDRQNLAALGNIIRTTIDMEESKLKKAPVIVLGFDKALDHYREQYEQIEHWLPYVVDYVREYVAPHYPDEASCVDAHYFPRTGFVISIDENAAELLGSWFSGTEKRLTLVFSSK